MQVDGDGDDNNRLPNTHPWVTFPNPASETVDLDLDYAIRIRYQYDATFISTCVNLYTYRSESKVPRRKENTLSRL